MNSGSEWIIRIDSIKMWLQIWYITVPYTYLEYSMLQQEESIYVY